MSEAGEPTAGGGDPTAIIGRGTAFEITFDGRPVACRSGWTLGAALVASGLRSWRTTRAGRRPRGLFCGIGVCFDCLVTVNGIPSVRACLAEARPGDVVRTQEGSGRANLDR